ncbi:MAG TPA: class I SAM-dependent methyltransferase [Gammaproteobacteria bacterium]|jgi:SAM-dependent methyltransferase
MHTALKDAFTTWCRESLFTPDMIQAAAILNKAADAHLTWLYQDLDLAAMLDNFMDAGELARSLRFESSADIALEAMLLRLADRCTFIEKMETEKSIAFRNRESPHDTGEQLHYLHKEMETLGEPYLAGLEFLDFGAGQFVRSLRDEPDFMDRVLTGKVKEYADTWHRATNTDPLQDVHGIMGARAVDDVFAGGVILEVGGGTGNGIRNILDYLNEQDHLDRLERFIFTDISMPFILSTRHEIRQRYPHVVTDWRHLDINKPFGIQKISPGSVDLVYGVNAAHIARHTVKFIEECKRVLKPGGAIVFSERVRMKDREMAPREIALNLSRYHRTAAIRDPEFRPMHAYLSVSNWLRAFELTGIDEVDIWPDIANLAESFPDQYAAIIVAKV